jgi:hypothetical protein
MNWTVELGLLKEKGRYIPSARKGDIFCTIFIPGNLLLDTLRQSTHHSLAPTCLDCPFSTLY